MKLEFDTRYINIVGGDIKTAMMFAIGVAQQIDADNTDDPQQYGNYWSKTVVEWQVLGFGGKDSQKATRKKLLATGLWKERDWGYPAQKEFWVNLEKLNETLEQMTSDDE